MGDSKAEYLKRYLEPKISKRYKKRVNDVTVKYVSGDLPETLDAFYNSADTFDIFRTEEEEEVKPTIVRQGTLKKQKNKTKDLEKHKKDAELEAKYDVWNKGIKTMKETYEKLKQQEYESSKPLARYADDADLTEHLKSKIHADDPMAKYFAQKSERNKQKKIKEKQKRRIDGISDSSEEEEEKPRYKGPEPPQNRYSIWPGYRWDGVNRSNGFEEKIIEEQTNRKVNRQIAQQWSMEDM